jgi:uncharacterized membrane protein
VKVRGVLIANLVLAAAMAAFGWWVASRAAPGAQLPIHWNAAGVADGFASATTALLWPAAMSALIGVLMATIPRLEPLQDRLDASAPVLRAAWIGVMGLMVYVQVMIAAPVLGWRIGPDLLLAGLGILLVMIRPALLALAAALLAAPLQGLFAPAVRLPHQPVLR